ncbi:MAG: NfeD family protein [Candidatus Dormiibacterota bacterium]
MALVWIVVALVFAITEVATVALFAGFLAIGALGAAVVAFVVPQSELAQAIAFVAVSAVGVLVVRPFTLRHLRHPVRAESLSGARSMIGETALVVRRIGGGELRGHARILGENWPALALDGEPIEAGSDVRVVDIHGATLVVERVLSSAPGTSAVGGARGPA